MGDCSWTGQWSKQRNHLVAHHASDTVQAEWYLAVEVRGLRLRPAREADRTFPDCRSSDVVRLGGRGGRGRPGSDEAADEAPANVILVHSLQLPGSARFAVQGLGAGPCCRYRLRFTTASAAEQQVSCF